MSNANSGSVDAFLSEWSEEKSSVSEPARRKRKFVVKTHVPKRERTEEERANHEE